MLKITLLAILILNAISSFCQSRQALPTMKSDRDTLDIRYDDNLNAQSWILSKRKKIDILKLPIEDSVKVTFISRLDSISFIVKVGEKYDFFIFNGKKKFYTRIEGIADDSKRIDSLAELNFRCLKTNLLSVDQRNKNYPFNKAAQIGLISFIDTTTNFFTPIPVKNGKLDQAKVREKKILDSEQVNELTDILYNIGRTPVPNLPYTTIAKSGCYEPRNGIIFIDSKGSVFEYIEICFACKESRFSSKKVKTGEYCNEKHDILRRFFLDKGLMFGTVESNY